MIKNDDLETETELELLKIRFTLTKKTNITVFIYEGTSRENAVGSLVTDNN